MDNGVHDDALLYERALESWELSQLSLLIDINFKEVAQLWNDVNRLQLLNFLAVAAKCVQ